MSDFKRTVALLAQQPQKHALFSMIPNALMKTGSADSYFDKKKILSSVATNVATTALTGAAGGLAYKLHSKFFGDPKEEEESHKELGKLNARVQHKLTNLNALKPLHERVLKKLLATPEFSSTDKDDLTSAYETMARFAPNLAADENAARSFIREHVFRGTLNAPHYSAIKTLVDTERAVAEAGGIAR